MSSRHRKPISRKAIAGGTATVLVTVALLLVGVMSAVSFARPDRSFAPPTEAKFFTNVVNSSATLKPHPRVIATDFSGPQVTIVKRGQTLSSIAALTLGSSKRWPILWWDNQSKIDNPNAIRVGMRLHFGTWHHVRPWLSKRALAAIPKPVPAPVAATPTAPQPVASSMTTVTTYSGGSGFQACVISRESGGNPAAVNPSSGAGGLYQFLLSTWDALGFGASYPGGAQTAPVSVQNAAFAKAFAESGTSPWAPYDGC